MTNIEELHELINPEMITDGITINEMLNKAFANRAILTNYIKKCLERKAKIHHCKLVTNISRYNVSFIDYYLTKKIEDINVGADCEFSEENEFGDGDYDENFEVISDYMEKD